MKKALILASVASMIDQFNMQNIRLLLEEGYAVDVIANFKQGNTISQKRIVELENELAQMGVTVLDVPIPRKISDIKGIISSYEIVKKRCDDMHYALVHCHSPIGGVIARLAAKKSRKMGTRVIYTAHGFHFYKGAPKKNWLIFYPIEKLCSRWTDVLITINKEDFEFAKKKMNAKQIEYVPGIGIDTQKFVLENFNKVSKRKELGLSEESVVLLSVGELNQNKNHETIVRALGEIDNRNLHYVIAGQGEKKRYLKELAESLGVNLHLLGYRTDIPELYNMADIFVFPSFREGLSVSLMEAMASGLPCIVSEIRGNVDLIDEYGGCQCSPVRVCEFVAAVDELICCRSMRANMGIYNREFVKQFDSRIVNGCMCKLYKE